MHEQVFVAALVVCTTAKSNSLLQLTVLHALERPVTPELDGRRRPAVQSILHSLSPCDVEFSLIAPTSLVPPKKWIALIVPLDFVQWLY